MIIATFLTHTYFSLSLYPSQWIWTYLWGTQHKCHSDSVRFSYLWTKHGKIVLWCFFILLTCVYEQETKWFFFNRTENCTIFILPLYWYTQIYKRRYIFSRSIQSIVKHWIDFQWIEIWNVNKQLPSLFSKTNQYTDYFSDWLEELKGYRDHMCLIENSRDRCKILDELSSIF